LASDGIGTPLGSKEKKIFSLESGKTVTNHDSDTTWVINVQTGDPSSSPDPTTYEIWIIAKSDAKPSLISRKKLKLKLKSGDCGNNSLNTIGAAIEVSFRLNRGLKTLPYLASK
jgi:hypothetical protein